MPDFDDEIDYLHPSGKGEEAREGEPTIDESAKPDQKSFDKALQEADGHSMKKPDPFLDLDEEST